LPSSQWLRRAKLAPVARTEPGTKAQVVFYRGGKRQELTITVAERPNKLTQ